MPDSIKLRPSCSASRISKKVPKSIRVTSLRESFGRERALKSVFAECKRRALGVQIDDEFDIHVQPTANSAQVTGGGTSVTHKTLKVAVKRLANQHCMSPPDTYVERLET